MALFIESKNTLLSMVSHGVTLSTLIYMPICPKIHQCFNLSDLEYSCYSYYENTLDSIYQYLQEIKKLQLLKLGLQLSIT